MAKLTKKVEETHNLFRQYSSSRDKWALHAQEDREFRLGVQWTAEQKRILSERGQAPIVVNRIHPAVEAAKAMLTTNKPSFRVSPREDSDNRIAQVMNGMLEYIWAISDGNTALRNIIDDYYVCGVGYMQVYQDPNADKGKGEVKIRDLDPLDVYVDPNSRTRMLDDAENIIVSRMFTKDQAIRMYPMYEKAIKNAQTDMYSDKPSTGRSREEVGAIFPEDTETTTRAVGWGESDEYIRGYERYHKEMIKYHLIHQLHDDKELLLDEEDFLEYCQKPVWLIHGQIVDDPSTAERMMGKLTQVFAEQKKKAEIEGQSVNEVPPPDVKKLSFADLIVQKAVEAIEVEQPRVKMCVIMGDKMLYERVLPTEHFPVVPFMNLHTRTPYPISDVRMVKDMQEYINKTRSLIIAHATTSTNVKILVPSGSVDMREFEQKWAQPGVAIEVDFDQGNPTPVQPLPLPNELYQNEQTAKNDIDHQLGLYEMMMGNSSVAPHTYKATISLDEFGQRKMKSKLMDIEAGLRRAAEVIIPLMQQLYTTEKVARVVQPNNSMSEIAINKKLYDDKGNEIGVFNDITVGNYDVVIVTGSTLPTNRYAQLELYMDAYKNGLIDRQEVLKKTEVFDIEGVLERTDTIAKLEQAVEQAQGQIKELKGDLQTREREVYHAKQKAELEKFKGDLDKTSTRAKAAGTVFEKRLDDATGMIRKEVNEASKETKDTPKSSKGSKKGK